MPINSWIEKNITPILFTITTVITIVNTVKTNTLDDNIKALSINETKQKLQHDSIGFDREFKFKVFAEVKDALKANNPQMQDAVKEIVIGMVDDSAYRERLIRIMIASKNTDSSIKRELIDNIKEQASFQEQQSIQPPSSSNNIRIDVFYAEETMAIHNTKANAERAVGILKTLGYNARPRVLPKLINSKPGYSIYENQIRYDDDEIKIAQQILGIMAKNGDPFKLKMSGQKTENYLSVFFY